MAREQKIRVVAFIPASLVEQYSVLSKRSGLSRSELIRMALQRAYRSIAVWCDRRQEEFSVDREVDKGGLAGSGSDRNEVQSASPVVQLTRYCQVLVEQDPDLVVDQVRAMALAQAAVVGVSSAESEHVVAAALRQLFPAQLGDGRDGLGSVGGDLD